MSYFIPMNQSMFLMVLFCFILNILIGNTNTLNIFLPYHTVVPFDTHNNWGWILLWFIQFNMGISYALSMVSIISYFVCCCFYIGAICEHFKFLICSIETDVTNKKAENKGKIKKISEQSEETKKLLSDKQKINKAVELHMTLFE